MFLLKMDRDQLEKLVKSSNGYRNSLSIEAAEVLEYIRLNRPDLYEHVLAEARRQEEPKVNSLATINHSPIEIETYIRPIISFHDLIPKNLENTIIIPHEQQDFVYIGKLKIDKDDDSDEEEEESFVLNVSLTKYVRETRIETYFKPFPPSLKKREVFNDKKMWEITGTYYLIIKEGQESLLLGYYDGLKEKAKKQGMLLPQSLLGAVFGPINQELIESYKQSL